LALSKIKGINERTSLSEFEGHSTYCDVGVEKWLFVAYRVVGGGLASWNGKNTGPSVLDLGESNVYGLEIFVNIKLMFKN